MIIRAKGPQDLDLTVNSEITFWRATYSRITNFAWEDIELTQRSGVPSWGNKVTFTLTRSGDLVSNMMLYFRVDPVFFHAGSTDDAVGMSRYFYTGADGFRYFNAKVFVDDLGHALIDSVVMKIGGYEIEKLTGDFMHVWSRLASSLEKSLTDSLPPSHGGCSKLGSDGALWKYKALQAANTRAADELLLPRVNRGDGIQHIYVPLQFTCCSVYGQALPIIALQYHDVDIEVTIKKFEDVSIFESWTSGGSQTQRSFNVKGTPASGQSKAGGAGGALTVTLLCRYIYLDDFERRSFALSPHTYLITETQYQKLELQNSSRQSHVLHFNHPVKELVMFVRKHAYEQSSSRAPVYNYWNFTLDGLDADGAEDPRQLVAGTTDRREGLSGLNLSLNQQKLYGEGRDSVYFGYLLPLQYHTKVPDSHDRVYIMPFGLDVECWRPTGSINFSRIDNVQLHVELPAPDGNRSLPQASLHVYARSHNQLKIVSGMGGKRWAS